MGIQFLKWMVGGNGGISLTLLLLMGFAAWQSRRQIVSIWRDPHPIWRAINRFALLLQGLVWLWITLFDYWRQLLGVLMTDQTRAYSDPYIVAPVLARHEVSGLARAVSLVLIAAGVIGLGLIIARVTAGPFLPLGMLAVGGLCYLVFYDARWRFDMWAANGFPQVGKGTTGDLLTDLAFFVPLVVFVAVVVLLLYLMLASLAALPVIVIGGFITERFTRPTPEYRAFTEALSTYASRARARDHGREPAEHHDDH